MALTKSYIWSPPWVCSFLWSCCRIWNCPNTSRSFPSSGLFYHHCHYHHHHPALPPRFATASGDAGRCKSFVGLLETPWQPITVSICLVAWFSILDSHFFFSIFPSYVSFLATTGVWFMFHNPVSVCLESAGEGHQNVMLYLKGVCCCWLFCWLLASSSPSSMGVSLFAVLNMVDPSLFFSVSLFISWNIFLSSWKKLYSSSPSYCPSSCSCFSFTISLLFLLLFLCITFF